MGYARQLCSHKIVFSKSDQRRENNIELHETEQEKTLTNIDSGFQEHHTETIQMPQDTTPKMDGHLFKRARQMKDFKDIGDNPAPTKQDSTKKSLIVFTN